MDQNNMTPEERLIQAIFGNGIFSDPTEGLDMNTHEGQVQAMVNAGIPEDMAEAYITFDDRLLEWHQASQDLETLDKQPHSSVVEMLTDAHAEMVVQDMARFKAEGAYDGPDAISLTSDLERRIIHKLRMFAYTFYKMGQENVDLVMCDCGSNLVQTPTGITTLEEEKARVAAEQEGQA